MTSYKLDELIENREKLRVALKEAQITRDQMDSKMQSRYDTQKEEWALQCDIYISQIEQLDKLINDLNKLEENSIRTASEIIVGSKVKLLVDDEELETYILLDDSGGYKFEGGFTLSTRSPIGQAILGLRVGDKVIVEIFGTKKYIQVIEIS